MEMWVLWVVFGVTVAGGLVLDLCVLHKRDERVSIRRALAYTGLWIAVALAFDVLIRVFVDPTRGPGGSPPSVEFLTCYVTEYALSVDNIFVFIVIFRFFAIPEWSQHRVLLWGVLGAMIMRALFLGIGIAAIHRFEWIMYGLGALLIVTGIKLAIRREDDELRPENNVVLRFVRRILPVTDQLVGSNFFTRVNGRLTATPLFLSLLVVETTDVLFAVDSVPAALGISQDMFVVYTSNIFAILGLRSLFFAVGGLVRWLHYLEHGLAAVLVFIGAKMLLPDKYAIPITWSLGVVMSILGIAIVASLIRARIVKGDPDA